MMIYDMILMMPQRGILIYIYIYYMMVLQDDILYDGFIWWWDVMRTRWWFRNITGSYRRTCYRGRIWEDYDSLHRGCLGDISSRRVVGVFSWYIIHSRHTQVNTSVDTVYGILWFSWYKIYMYYVLKSICIIKETLVVSDFVLARGC